MKTTDLTLDSGIWESLQPLVPGLERWVESGSGKLHWVFNRAIGQGGILGRGSYLSQHFSDGVPKRTGSVREMLHEIAFLTNTFWNSQLTWRY